MSTSRPTFVCDKNACHAEGLVAVSENSKVSVEHASFVNGAAEMIIEQQKLLMKNAGQKMIHHHRPKSALEREP